jgi:predicted xylan-binding protein with Ca-dependent carbohydrate-binding module/copper-binding protein NosD
MTTFYVSPTGNDSAAGTSAATAFKTLAKAQAAMAGSSGADTAIVGGGTYSIAAPVAMTSANTGDTFTAASGQTAILDGGGRKESLITLNNASNVTIQGLTFQNTAAGNDNDAAPGAIAIASGTGNVVTGDTFTNVAKGVVLTDATHGVTVAKSTFTNIANTAVHLDSGTYGITVTSNTMTHIGYTFGEGGAIQIYGSSGNTISHNAITDTAYHGIDQNNYNTGGKTGGNTIEYNVLKNTVQVTDDGGAIYSFGKQAAGDTIRYNYVDTTGGNPSWGIYLDDYTSNDQVYSNFVTGARNGGVMIHGGSNNQIHNNVLINSQTAGLMVMQIDDDGIASTNNAIYQNLIQVPAQGPVTATDPVVPAWFHNNVYVSSQGNGTEWGYDGGTLSQWFAMGGDKGTVVTSSAGFTNAAARDYSFAPGSAALQQGLQQLPFSSMGPTSGGSSGGSSGGGGTANPPPPPQVTLDTLVLQLSGDPYRGNPQFIVKVDGKQLADPQPVAARHSDGEVQAFTFQQDWSTGSHTVEIDFTNDRSGRYGGDRDLWVDKVTYDGKSYGPASPVELRTNSQHFIVAVGQ